MLLLLLFLLNMTYATVVLLESWTPLLLLVLPLDAVPPLLKLL